MSTLPVAGAGSSQSGAGAPRVGAGIPQSGADPFQTVRFPVAGMTCQACVVHITRAVRGLPGVDRVKVDLRHETVTVGRHPTVATDDILAAAVSEVGYELDLAAGEILPTEPERGCRERWWRRCQT